MTRTPILLLAGLTLLAAPYIAAGSTRVLAVGQDPVVRNLERGPDTMLSQAPNAVNGLFSDLGCDMCAQGLQIIGENFIVSTGGAGYDLDEITIWGGYFPTDVPVAAPFDIYIAADAAGVPGTMACYATGITPTSDTLTGVTLFGVSEHLIVLTISGCTLADGTYWLYLFTDTGTGTDDLFWETGTLDGTNGIAGSVWATTNPPSAWNFDGATDLATQITGTIVPVELQSLSVE
jgi:hypothetical protein